MKDAQEVDLGAVDWLDCSTPEKFCSKPLIPGPTDTSVSFEG